MSISQRTLNWITLLEYTQIIIMRIPFLVAFLMLFFSSTFVFAQNKTQSENDMIDQVYKLFGNAYKFKNADMFKHLYTEDCIFLDSEASSGIKNQAGAIDSFREMFENGSRDGLKYEINFKFTRRDVIESIAYDAGYYELTTINYEGEPSKSYGKFLTILKKGEDGIWRIFADSYSKSNEDAYMAIN